jgi:hypothetical protein
MAPPEPWAMNWRAATWPQRKTPFAFTPMLWSYSSSVTSTNGAIVETPAFETQISSGPRV